MAQVIGATILLVQTRLPHVDPHHPHLASSTPLVLYGRVGGVRGRGPVLDWHVVGMSLTSQGSGENKPDSPHHRVYGSFVRCPGEPAGPPAGGQGNKTTAW